jgi:hypothetical protein
LHRIRLLWAHYMLKTIKIILHYKLCTWNTILQAKQTDKQRVPQRDKDERKREERERAQREWNISKREGEILKREEKNHTNKNNTTILKFFLVKKKVIKK